MENIDFKKIYRLSEIISIFDNNDYIKVMDNNYIEWETEKYIYDGTLSKRLVPIFTKKSQRTLDNLSLIDELNLTFYIVKCNNFIISGYNDFASKKEFNNNGKYNIMEAIDFLKYNKESELKVSNEKIDNTDTENSSWSLNTYGDEDNEFIFESDLEEDIRWYYPINDILKVRFDKLN